MSIKQATLNKHVNVEAVEAYAIRLREWAQSERWEGRDETAIDLEYAAALLDGASQVTGELIGRLDRAAYDRIYR
jgi:hypothetical protein